MTTSPENQVPKIIKPFFILASLYDGILGLLFLLAPIQLYAAAGVTLPNHLGYIQFPACLLIIFAIMFYQIAKNPIANKNLIIYGIMLKISYCSVVFYYWFLGNIPFIWKPFAILDALFLVAFIGTYKALKDKN